MALTDSRSTWLILVIAVVRFNVETTSRPELIYGSYALVGICLAQYFSDCNYITMVSTSAIGFGLLSARSLMYAISDEPDITDANMPNMAIAAK